ncbi:MAG TPA: hypothetical protein VM261_28830 [Kofleriaceae bacterium]|nr:hypothetical protein [Kofleriaceae bacterium]
MAEAVRSRARHLVIGGILAVIVNVAINAAVGQALYGGVTVVPLSGDSSIAGDTIVGAFLIGFFTLLLVAPATRREVRAGRVRGGHRWLALTGWFARHPFVAAVAFGVVSAVALGGGAVAIIAAIDAAPMSSDDFVVFKTAFAGAWGGLASVLIAAVVAAGERQPPDDERWCRDPERAVPVTYPFDYIDKGGLAVTSERHGCSGTPTWQLVVNGVPDPAAVRAALADLLVRYPTLTTRVQSLDAIPEYARRFRYASAPTEVDAMFELVDLRGRPAGELDAVIQEVWDRHLDQFRDPPVSLTMVITGDAHCRLLFRQHHGIADGRAFIGLLTDFAAFLRARQTGASPSPAALEPIGRRGELEALGLSRATRVRYGLAGFGSLMASIVKALVRPTTMLVPNESADYTGANGAVRWIVDDTVLDDWQRARKELGVSQSALFTAALFVATQRWHQELGRRLGRVNASLVMETRPRDGSFVSFANHLATLEVELDLKAPIDPATAARSFHAQLKRQLDGQRPLKRLVCERAIVATMPLDKLHELVFEAKRPAFNLNLSNLIPLDFPVLSGPGWTVAEVLITTPVTPRNGIVLTVVRYNGRVCFNFNYVASAVSAAQVTDVAGRFRDALESLTGTQAVERAIAA